VSKLLETKLPLAIGEISPETFNRLVRVLELSLNKVDIDSTLSVNETQRNNNKFQQGDIIWNLTAQELQLWTGKEWISLYERREFGVEATASLGKLTISTNGSTSINI
tara:strand:+ start:845 stop:1168 length:324 start_codon:yes stop_codon:yes gene_type:complete